MNLRTVWKTGKWPELLTDWMQSVREKGLRTTSRFLGGTAVATAMVVPLAKMGNTRWDGSGEERKSGVYSGHVELESP